MFLSDLCGREVATGFHGLPDNFLSDLCGREGKRGYVCAGFTFLSDLCGREEIVLMDYSEW